MDARDLFAKWREDLEYVRSHHELEPDFCVADQVLRLRLERGWTQKELADRAGTSQANISRLENAVGSSTLRFVQRVAAALGATLDPCLRVVPESPAEPVTVVSSDTSARLLAHQASARSSRTP